MTPRFLAWQIHGAIDGGKGHRRRRSLEDMLNLKRT